MLLPALNMPLFFRGLFRFCCRFRCSSGWGFCSCCRGFGIHCASGLCAGCSRRQVPRLVLPVLPVLPEAAAPSAPTSFSFLAACTLRCDTFGSPSTDEPASHFSSSFNFSMRSARVSTLRCRVNAPCHFSMNYRATLQISPLINQASFRKRH